MVTRLVAITAALASLALYSAACAQQPSAPVEEAKTKLESFQRQTGTVLIKGYTEIGAIVGLGNVSVDCMEFTDATTGRHQTGVLIEVKESGHLERSDRSFIDYDEIDPLLKGIDYISQATPAVTALASFEAMYKTRGEFSATTFNTGTKIGAAIKSGYIGGVTAYISLQQLGQLRAFIVEAKNRLDSIK